MVAQELRFPNLFELHPGFPQPLELSPVSTSYPRPAGRIFLPRSLIALGNMASRTHVWGFPRSTVSYRLAAMGARWGCSQNESFRFLFRVVVLARGAGGSGGRPCWGFWQKRSGATTWSVDIGLQRCSRHTDLQVLTNAGTGRGTVRRHEQHRPTRRDGRHVPSCGQPQG